MAIRLTNSVDVGGYHWCDLERADEAGMLYAGGPAYPTKAAAMRAAAFDGYTHATGSGTYWEGVRAIPDKYRD